jgi:acyl carrier protein
MTAELRLEIIETDLIKFLRESIVSEAREFDANTSLSSLGIDSFNLIQILLFIERRFKVSLPDAALTQENLRSVAAIALCVNNVGQ